MPTIELEAALLTGTEVVAPADFVGLALGAAAGEGDEGVGEPCPLYRESLLRISSIWALDPSFIWWNAASSGLASAKAEAR